MVARTEHEMTPAVAGRLAAVAGPTGLVLGREANGRPALLRMFRPQPTRITVVGSSWLAWILVFRSLALGARALVGATDPSRWQGLGGAATGAADRIMVVGPQHAPVRGYIAVPVLHVFDLDGRRPMDLGPGDGWQTTMTLADQLNVPAAEALAGSDAVVVQRMWPQQVEYVAGALGIDQQLVAPIAAMPPDAVAVLRLGEVRFVRLAATATEQHLFGTPRR